jgi:hypothetical protein
MKNSSKQCEMVLTALESGFKAQQSTKSNWKHRVALKHKNYLTDQTVLRFRLIETFFFVVLLETHRIIF